MRVLIVDDEKLAREAIEHIIVSSDYDMKVVAQAQNAKEALSMYKMYNPDVIITDICMDGEDGLNLIEEIHRYDSNSNVIVLSAYEKFEYAKAAAPAGEAPDKEFEDLDDAVEKYYCTDTGKLASSSCYSTAVGWYKKDNLPEYCSGHYSPSSSDDEEEEKPTKAVTKTTEPAEENTKAED